MSIRIAMALPSSKRTTSVTNDMLANSIEDVCVVDVYDLATDIGKECEKIIETHGTAAMAGLIPKMINALEVLEGLAHRNEIENSLIQELNERIIQLENEKLEKAEYRKRFEKELEAIEDQWRNESRELVGLVSRLQEQNTKLLKKQTAITPTDNTLNSSNNLPDSPEKANDGQILQKLTTQVEQLRNELKNKDRDLQEKASREEHLSTQMERLKNSGRESRRRQKLLQSQIQTLCEERADFLAQLQDQHRDLLQLKRQLGIAEKENEDLTSCQYDDNPDRPRYTTAELKEVLSERNELKTKIIEMEEELMALRPIPEKPTNTADNSTPNGDEDDDPPVQGPLPFEPDDAPWKRKEESGIRKFFRKLFSESESGTPSSFRSLSTLSKMALSSGPHSDIPI